MLAPSRTVPLSENSATRLPLCRDATAQPRGAEAMSLLNTAALDSLSHDRYHRYLWTGTSLAQTCARNVALLQIAASSFARNAAQRCDWQSRWLRQRQTGLVRPSQFLLM